MPKKYYEMKSQGARKAEIYLFGFIGNSMWDDINPKKFIADLKDLGELDVLTVRINSEGGSVTAGNVIYNALKNHTATVITHVEGIAASMASVIAMAGDEVVMAANALMMIHDPWTYAEGNAAQLRKIADVLDKAKDTCISSYTSKTGLDSETVSQLMTDETWMTADEAIQYGFASSITEPIDMAARIRGLNLSGYKNVPKTILPTTSAKADFKAEEKTMPDKQVKAQELAQADATINPLDMQAAAEKAAADALRAEDNRRAEVASVFSLFGAEHAELKSVCLMDRGISKADAQAKLLAKLGEKSEPLGRDVRVVETGREKMMLGFANALMGRSGMAQAKGLERNEFRGYTLVEMARNCLETRGIRTSSMDKMEMVGAAFTHSSGDFSSLLSNVMFKSMLKGWDEAPETFQQWTTPGTLTDFKPTSRVDLNAFPALSEVPAGAEYKYATIGDRGETTQLATYGNLFSINRQAIINDDLQAFTKIPMKMGRAALRTIGNLVYAVLTGNPNMSDGVALFHSTHANLGTTGALATGTVDELRVKMALQKDPQSNVTALGISPSFLLVPEALRGAGNVVMESETEIGSSQNNSKKPNSVRNIATVVSDARLDAVSATAFYLVASPQMHDTIEVSYLDGVQQPYLEQQQGWTIDGTQFKVRIDAAVKALDFRTMARNAGA